MSCLGTHAIRNGVLIAEADAVLPILQKEVQYGFGVYESLRVINGQVVYLVDHLQRLMNSAKGISLKHQFTTTQITEWIYLLMYEDAIVEATFRILLMGGPSPLLYITASPILSYPDLWYTCGVSVTSYRGERFLPRYKTCSLLMNYIALQEAQEQGAFEALLVDREGRILEGTRSNFFACKGDIIHTAADDFVLEGVTRDKIIRAVAELGYRISWDTPKLEDVLKGQYDELFISSTSMGALPVSSVDGFFTGAQFSHAQAIHSLIRQWELEALH
jgi:branched-chain amino acid aminotransferase